ncbi:hypothetical protein C3L33_00890, partial [Rhododendron williamsianum]
MDDALVASFMSHFAPDQGCSTTVSSQTLVHSQLVRKFLCHWNRVRVTKDVTWNSTKTILQVEIKRVYERSRQGKGGILRVGSLLAFNRPADRGFYLHKYEEPSDLFSCIEHFDEDNGVVASQFEECRNNTLACFDNVFP